MAYPLGTEIQITGSFSNLTGLLADPSTITLFIQSPGMPQGTSNQYTYANGQVMRQSVGVYTFNLILTTPGTWYYAWEGTGQVQTATFDIPIQVQPSVLRTS